MLIRILLLVLLLICETASALEPMVLRAGALSMVFDPSNAALRRIRAGKYPVLSGINAPVRNQFWGTVPPVLSNMQLNSEQDNFTLTFDVTCREREIDFFWQGRIEGRADGKLIFVFRGQAKSTFLRNRIGFCVLHGPEVAGKACQIQTTAGAMVKGSFPKYISPHQPFKEIRAITHEVTPGILAHVRMEGDTFEMEDQRNWTDASFKTYCTPLELPYPVEVAEGARIEHRIELQLEGDLDMLDNADRAADVPIVLELSPLQESRPATRLPRIGLQVSSQVDQLTDIEIKRVKPLHLDHLRIDLSLYETDWTRRLRQASDQAKALDVRLHVGLHLGDNPAQELASLISGLATIRPPVSYWLILATDVKTLREARRRLRAFDGSALIGMGQDTNFTELNRDRPDVDAIDVVSYGLNPQVHAFDNVSLIETLAIQGDTVHSARQFVGDLPLLISPITLRKQSIDQAPLAGELPSNVDPRQMTDFAAGWTLGSIKYLAEAGVECLTYYETVGWKGVMESSTGSQLPERFPSTAGAVYPVYHLLKAIGEFSGGRVRLVQSTDPESVIGFALEKDGKTRLLVANLTNRPQAIDVRGLNHNALVYDLERSDHGEAVTGPLKLTPFSVAKLDQTH